MGLLDRLSPKAMNTDELSRLILSTYGGGSTATGISVTTDNAMRAMAVHTCVTIKANALKQLPCHLMRQIGEKKEKALDHPYYELLHDQPNEWMTSPEFWGMVSGCIDLQGNFIALKTGIPGRPIRELIPFAPGAVEDVIQTPTYGLFYKVRRPNANQSTSDIGTIGQSASTTVDMIPGERILHIKGLVLNGFMGLNPIAYARESVGLALATERHGAKLFKQGTMLNGVVKMTGRFKTDAEARAWIDNFNESFSSVENSWKTALLEDGATWEKLGMTSEDSQFMEARGFQTWEIACLFFGLPLMVISGRERTATFASAEEFSNQFVTYAMLPRIVDIEKRIRLSLLKELPEGLGTPQHYAKFSVDGLLRASLQAFAAANAILIDKEVLNPNEVRDLLDRNPYDGGSQYRTRTSTTKQDSTAPDKGATK